MVEDSQQQSGSIGTDGPYFFSERIPIRNVFVFGNTGRPGGLTVNIVARQGFEVGGSSVRMET